MVTAVCPSWRGQLAAFPGHSRLIAGYFDDADEHLVGVVADALNI
jgi:hypothetical protein